MAHVWDKLCGYLYYGLKYIMFIVAYVILKL